MLRLLWDRVFFSFFFFHIYDCFYLSVGILKNSFLWWEMYSLSSFYFVMIFKILSQIFFCIYFSLEILSWSHNSYYFYTHTYTLTYIHTYIHTYNHMLNILLWNKVSIIQEKFFVFWEELLTFQLFSSSDNWISFLCLWYCQHNILASPFYYGLPQVYLSVWKEKVSFSVSVNCPKKKNWKNHFFFVNQVF